MPPANVFLCSCPARLTTAVCVTHLGRRDVRAAKRVGGELPACCSHERGHAAPTWRCRLRHRCRWIRCLHAPLCTGGLPHPLAIPVGLWEARQPDSQPGHGHGTHGHAGPAVLASGGSDELPRPAALGHRHLPSDVATGTHNSRFRDSNASAAHAWRDGRICRHDARPDRLSGAYAALSRRRPAARPAAPDGRADASRCIRYRPPQRLPSAVAGQPTDGGAICKPARPAGSWHSRPPAPHHLPGQPAAPVCSSPQLFPHLWGLGGAPVPGGAAGSRGCSAKAAAAAGADSQRACGGVADGARVSGHSRLAR